jgi:phosphomannomutase
LSIIIFVPQKFKIYNQMTLIKSISGIRGTIGGKVGDNLTPIDAVKFASGYGTWLKQNSQKENPNSKFKVVVGRDARISGPMIHNLVVNTLIGLGIDVVDLGLSTTPTVEVAVPLENADGGIILTASHNPKQWNALKLLNEKGEFLNGIEGEKILQIAEAEAFDFSEVDDLGKVTKNDAYMDIHIDEVLNLPLVDSKAVKAAKFKVVVDGVNSSGGIIIPRLLELMGVEVIKLYCEPNGHFPHNPEPLKEHLTDISKLVVKEKADLGIVVDPDVDRLAFICEDGEMFGEEYTLVACADYVLEETPGNTVSNMSSSRALRDVTNAHKGSYEASAVGEVNVVELMKKNKAVIGGEGNGGIIYPELHYGRDSLVGVALFLTHLANKKMTVSALRASYPEYYMSKNKIELTPQIDVDGILEAMTEKYKDEKITTIDGVKIDFAENWVHLRKSNTEPIIRIYTEAATQEKADDLAIQIIEEIKAIAGI